MAPGDTHSDNLPIVEDFHASERFEIQRELGAGGMGVVYEAFDRELQTTVALKTLHRLTPQALYLFKNEFRAISGIRHPNLVRLGELFHIRGQWFFSMEMVQGQDFLTYVMRRPATHRDDATMPVRPSQGDALASLDVSTSLDVDDALGRASTLVTNASEINAALDDIGLMACDETRLRDTLKQLVQGLHALHAAGKIHRDIKPSNVVVEHDGRVVILDFGLVFDATRRASMVSHYKMAGTLLYMAPEQAGSAPVGKPADWYALGIMLFQAMTGRLPFTGKPLEVLEQKSMGIFDTPRTLMPHAPQDLSDLCVALLSPHPDARPDALTVLRWLNTQDPVIEQAALRSTRPAPSTTFVGRAHELETLRQAFVDSRVSGPVMVCVQGDSGLGKSALIAHVLEQLRAQQHTLLVLEGACLERESVRYKAFDRLIDALTSHLRRIPVDQFPSLFPERAGLAALSQLFPVLGRVEGVVAMIDDITLPDVQDNPQHRALQCLRQLLTTLATMQPIVLLIDNLQWADTDSITLLREVLRPPHGPNLLLIATLRRSQTNHGSAAMAHHTTQLAGDVRLLNLPPLSPTEAKDLAERIAPVLVNHPELGHAIAQESQGYPCFVQLITEVALHTRRPPSLHDAIQHQWHTLPGVPKRMVEAIATASVPLSLEVLSAALTLPPGHCERWLEPLRDVGLIRSESVGPSDTVAPFHERIRDPILRPLSASERIAHHRALAHALSTHGTTRRESLAIIHHLEHAGDTLAAATYARELAETHTLDHDLVTHCLADALRLGTFDDDTRRILHLRRAEAFAAHGRFLDAATAYRAALDIRDDDDDARRLVLHTLHTGQLDLPALIHALPTAFERIDRSPHALRRLTTWHRHRLPRTPRPLRSRPKPHDPRATLLALADALCLLDPTRGAYLHARITRQLLAAGPTDLQGRALALTAAYRARRHLHRDSRSAHALNVATRLLDEHDHAQHMMIRCAKAMVFFYRDQFVEADITCARTLRLTPTLDPHPATIHHLALMYRMRTLHVRGYYNELNILFKAQLNDAYQRHDLLQESLTHLLSIPSHLARDDIEAAAFSLQVAHQDSLPPMLRWLHLAASAETTLYRSEDAGYFSRYSDLLHALRDTGIPHHAGLRRDMLWLMGRLMLADLEALPANPPQLIKTIHQCQRMLRRFNTPVTRLWSHFLCAALRRQHDDPEGCRTHLHHALDLAQELDLPAPHAIARLRLAGLSDAQHTTHHRTALADLHALGIQRPAAFAQVIAPGFSIAMHQFTRTPT